VKDPRFERLTCSHQGTYADDCIVQRITQVCHRNVYVWDSYAHQAVTCNRFQCYNDSFLEETRRNCTCGICE